MAILVEGISVVVRRPRIETIYPGGWAGFVVDCPNRTLCADRALARVGFMAPADALEFARRLESVGLSPVDESGKGDFIPVDQIRGPAGACSWLEFGHVVIGGNEVAACRDVESSDSVLITPDGWTYERSLSASPGFVAADEIGRTLRFLRHENGLDVYLHLPTGRELYLGRTGSQAPLGESNENDTDKIQ